MVNSYGTSSRSRIQTLLEMIHSLHARKHKNFPRDHYANSLLHIARKVLKYCAIHVSSCSSKADSMALTLRSYWSLRLCPPLQVYTVQLYTIALVQLYTIALQCSCLL